MILIRRREALAWDLRLRMESEQEVVLALADGAAVPRLRGFIIWVGASSQGCLIDDPRHPEPVMAPLSHVLSVRRPHFHEDRPLQWSRPRVLRDRAPEPIPGQLRLGGEPPDVSPRSRAAVQRAAGLLLPEELMGLLGALDRAVRGRSTVSTERVAEEAGRSPGETVGQLARLAEMKLCSASVEGERYEWSPGE